MIGKMCSASTDIPPRFTSSVFSFSFLFSLFSVFAFVFSLIVYVSVLPFAAAFCLMAAA